MRAGSERILPPQSVVKAYEYEKDRYAALDPEELKSIAPKTATEMQIEEFVRLPEVAVLEKLSFGIGAMLLYRQNKLDHNDLWFAVST